MSPEIAFTAYATGLLRKAEDDHGLSDVTATGTNKGDIS